MFYQCLSLMPIFWWSLVGWHRFLSSLPEKWKRRTWSSWQRRPPKRFPSSKYKKTHKYIEIETNTQKANIDTLKYTNTHINRHDKGSPQKESVEKAGPPQPKKTSSSPPLKKYIYCLFCILWYPFSWKIIFVLDPQVGISRLGASLKIQTDKNK